MNLRSHLATTASAVLLVGAGFVAGKVPLNSVGSPQIKNNSVASVDLKDNNVASVDLKDGSVSAVDLAPGTLPSQTTLANTRNGLGGAGCGVGGWCYLTTAGSGTTVANFDVPPANATGWTSTGTIELAKPSSVLLTATPMVWFFGNTNLDVVCTIKDGTTGLVSSGWVRSNGNQSQILSVTGVVSLAAGTHAIYLACRGGTVEGTAVTSATMTAVIIPGS